MMPHLVALSLVVVGLAAASPSAPPPMPGALRGPRYPETAKSKGFHLVVNVTDRANDFHPSIQDTYIASIHVGAGLALVGEIQSKKNARIFYQNGTADQRRSHSTSVITDGGTPPFPSGIKLVKDKSAGSVSTARLDAGPGDAGIGITAAPDPYAFLFPETWLACNKSIAYYQGKYMVIFKRAPVTIDAGGAANRSVPAGCVAVRLLPQCTELNELPKDAYSSHAYALEDRCYRDVRSIKWSDYSPDSRGASRV